ncbi:hypothetical protein P7D58_19410, partial [Enterococcus avium]|uniref:hypothetical protein n=1 Tax=Enterococcus avium TaxID=33945 RepID=UPI0028916C9D
RAIGAITPQHSQHLIIFVKKSVAIPATIYFDESSVAIIIPHYENKIYSYVKKSNYPCLNEAENDKQWIEDLEKGFCMVQTLSTENLFIALKYWFESLKYKGFY